MPLHSVPLCSFKYVGDVYTKALFDYNFSCNIFKTKSKYVDKVENKIYKRQSKIISKNAKDIKKNDIKIVLKENGILDKSKGKCLSTLYKSISINNTKSLNNIYDELFKINNKYIDSFNVSYINKNDNFLLSNAFMKNININSNKNLAMLDDIQIKHLMECFNMYRVSYRDIYISNNRKLESISDIYINKNSVFNFNILNDSIINKIKSVNVFNPRIIDIYNNVILKNLLRNNEYDNNKSFERYLSRVNIRYINKHAPSLYAYRYNLKDLYVGADLKELDQIMRHDIMRGDSKLFEKYSVQDIYINNLELKALYLNKRKYMYYENKYKYFSGLSTKFMDKYKNKFVIPYGNAQIYKFDFYMLRKIGTWNAFKYISYYVSKAGALSIYKEFQNLLQKTELPIFKYKEHYLSKSYWYDIFKQHEYMLRKSDEYIFKNKYDKKSLEVTKRWWWLNPTDSKDSLIIPNVDFIYNSSLLNNTNFEYLRFDNHPINWGEDWGMDFNIPSYAVSIEIMLDLVNILIMIWHDNVQGWLCCTGKEGIQFVMELLYDWYTLDTSKPNTDYYRAYRWIRWEAEKAYFLNLDNGLQAIGVLISNLIDYLKNHHFDIVPLWRNPKAMDIERNFNRLAQNGDLMKASDKTKGKRYYYIENKNENKKNILGDDV